MPTTVTRQFSYTGSQQTLTLPFNITGPVTITCRGAGGANAGGSGGNGGRIIGTISATRAAGKTFYIYVGGGGSDVNGGWNGGGDGYNTSETYTGGGGGGCTDIRLNATSLAYRICVGAGGGGGAHGTAGGDGGGGSNGNGEAGQDGGSSGTPYGGGGGGGTQTSGGAGGSSSTGTPAQPGGPNYGGHSSHVTDGGNGGGGGAGFFGGGGGGGHTTPPHLFIGGLGGGGGGGSNYGGGLDSVSTNDNGGAGATSDGSATVVYTIADPVVVAMAFKGNAQLAATGPTHQLQPMHMAGSAQLLDGGGTLDLASLALQSYTSMSITRAPSYLTSIVPMSAVASINDRATSLRFAHNAMSAQTSLFIEENLGFLGLSAQASMSELARHITQGILSLNGQARLAGTGFDQLQSRSALFSTSALMILSPILSITKAFRMAAHGSVSQSGGVLASRALPTKATASMRLTGVHKDILTATYTGQGRMNFSIALRHPYGDQMTANATMFITPKYLVFVGPTMATYASLDLSNTQLSNVDLFGAIASLTIANVPTLVQNAPYLYVDGPYSDMAFFVTSEPNPGDVRQLVTNRVES